VLDHRTFATREAFDAAIAAEVESHGPDLVLLAGFMRIFTAGFIQRFPRRILNIHPSLLPAFPGLHTHRRALEAGVKVHGATVHMVTPALDDGPIVIQGAVPVLQEDTEESLAERVLGVEHRIYPQAVRWFVEDASFRRQASRPGCAAPVSAPTAWFLPGTLHEAPRRHLRLAPRRARAVGSRPNTA
jgi:phosphoribosylglycinamide formyltransferase-1